MPCNKKHSMVKKAIHSSRKDGKGGFGDMMDKYSNSGLEKYLGGGETYKMFAKGDPNVSVKDALIDQATVGSNLWLASKAPKAIGLGYKALKGVGSGIGAGWKALKAAEALPNQMNAAKAFTGQLPKKLAPLFPKPINIVPNMLQSGGTAAQAINPADVNAAVEAAKKARAVVNPIETKINVVKNTIRNTAGKVFKKKTAP